MMHSSDEILSRGNLSPSLRPAQNIDVSDNDFTQTSPPKKQTSDSRWNILARSLIIIPPIAISIAILTLNFRSVFWGLPTTKTNTILSALQFAAQIHASLLVASISMMVLNMIQHGLATKKGIPLGLLSANFYVDSPTWLFRTEFKSLGLKYTLIFPWIVALAILSAPSSAIVMLPRLQFWGVEDVWLGKDNIDFRVYMQADKESLYPQTINAEMSARRCAAANASILPECPSYGIRRLIMEEQLFEGRVGTVNVTIQGKWNRYIVGHDALFKRGSSDSYASSTLSTFLGDAMLAYHSILSYFSSQNIGKSNGLGTLQRETEELRARYDLSFRNNGKKVHTQKPVVEVQCKGLPSNSTSFTLPHDMLTMGDWATDPILSAEWSVPLSDYPDISTDFNSTIVNASIIHSEQFGNVKPSLGAIFATSEILHSDIINGESSAPWAFFVCTFNARWMKTDTYLEIASIERTVFDSFPDPRDNGYTERLPGDGQRDVSSVMMYISESWANLLNVPWVDSLATPTPTNRTILDTIGQKCLDKHTFLNATFAMQKPIDDGKLNRVSVEATAVSTCLQASLSVYLTDALSRAHESVPIYINAEGTVDDPTPKSIYPSILSISQSIYDDPFLFGSGAYFAPYRVNLTAVDFRDADRFTEIRLRMSRYGYGYGFQDSILIYVGVVILLLHAAVSVVYFVWVVSMARHPGTDDRTIGKLLVLGMQSGRLGSSDSSVAFGTDERSVKRMWRTRYGLRSNVGSETKRMGTVILERR
ncbi:hypothetical protein IFR05_012761 [Cadophora sp. M221]|nr:hypothetical protein IFR05_012761 [Cadophora sp. M221]